MLSLKKKDRPKIIDIINIPFVKKRVIKYIQDSLSPETINNTTDVDDMHLDSLKEQAKNYKIEAKDEKIDGDKATVTVTNGEKGEEKLDLVKKDGKWLVNMSKEGMGAGEPAVAPVDGEVPVDEAMPTTEGKDSVKVETK